MKIIVISSNKKTDTEANVVTSMFEHGLETFHLRKPKLTTKELAEYIEQIPAHFHNRIVTHTHHALAGKYKLKGIHFTKGHLKTPRRTWWKLKLLSWKRPLNSMTLSSSHSKLSTLYEPDDYPFNYVFVSPVFDSLTGKFQSGFYEEGIKAANAKSGKKIIARGGVSAEKIEKVKELGFYGLALYSALWDKPHPLAEFINVMRKCKELGIQPE
jgi:thiamine-phosphate pyrophosphorylase